MAITTAWTSPAEGGTLDLSAGNTLTAAVWEALMSDVLRLGGTAGLVQTTDAGLLLLNDTANAKMTVGLTINQGANDDEALSLKSSDVAHGMTDQAETDTYTTLAKVSATAGGVSVKGFSEATVAIEVDGFGVTDDTAKTTSGAGYVAIRALKKNGTTWEIPGADANLLVVSAGTTTRFIFDQEGTFHADVASTTFDDYDDVALLNKFDAALTRDPVKTEFGRYLGDYRDELQRAKIVDSYDDAEGRTMVNFTRLTMLLVGACRQMGTRLADTEERLAAAESMLAALPDGGM